MKLQVLISAMHQKNISIAAKTNINSDAIIINQCDVNLVEKIQFAPSNSSQYEILLVNTTERGLSKSRNMAIRYSNADICLLCDDDEVLDDKYASNIISAFRQYQDDVILFRLNHPSRKFKNYTYKLGYFDVSSLSSWQIAFKRQSIIENGIRFNEKMGSGTENGAGEENKFIMDCIKRKLSVRYVPIIIGSLLPDGTSQWFHGFDKKYWINRGWQSKMIFGRFWGYIYIWYYVLWKKEGKDSMLDKINWLHKGFFLNR